MEPTAMFPGRLVVGKSKNNDELEAVMMGV